MNEIKNFPGVPDENATESMFIVLADSSKDIKSIIQKASKSGRPGPTGITYTYLTQILETNIRGEECSRQLISYTKIINKFLNGEMPEWTKTIFNAAAIIALEKAKGGIRPIGCVEVHRKITVKAAMKILDNEIKTLFKCNQFAVGKRNGAEIILIAIQLLVRYKLDFDIATFDIENAHSQTNTRLLREDVENDLPAMLSLYDMLYEDETMMITDIQIDGTVAVVTVKEEGFWGTLSFTDYFTLSVLEGRWQITNKTFAHTGGEHA